MQEPEHLAGDVRQILELDRPAAQPLDLAAKRSLLTFDELVVAREKPATRHVRLDEAALQPRELGAVEFGARAVQVSDEYAVLPAHGRLHGLLADLEASEARHEVEALLPRQKPATRQELDACEPDVLDGVADQKRNQGALPVLDPLPQPHEPQRIVERAL